MHDVKRMNGLEPQELPAELPPAAEAPPPVPEVVPFVHCEVRPLPTGAAVALAAPAADGSGEDSLVAGLNVTQAREVAARLLMCADQASGGETRTVLVITPEKDWVPGQCLQIRFTPEPSYGFTLDTRKLVARPPVAVPSRKKLILPGQ